jgi:hypothetical protein
MHKFFLIQNGWDTIWVKRKIDVCEKELIVTETHTSFNQNNKQIMLSLY